MGSIRMRINSEPRILSSEITDERTYLRRREWLQMAGAAALSMAAGRSLAAAGRLAADDGGFGAPGQQVLPNIKPNVVTLDEPRNTFEQITTYNNFYEFGTGKGDPARFSGSLKTSPWKVKVDGLCGKPADYLLEDLIKPFALEERVYRLRCVEGWSMVIPWVGIPLSEVLKRAEPTSKAGFVEF